MDFNKIPRWALIALSLVGMGALGTLFSSAHAEMAQLKTVAYGAKNLSERNQNEFFELKDSFKEFRKEYKDDQREISRVLTDIRKAVKA